MSHNSFHSISSLSFFRFHIFTLFFSISYLHSLFFDSVFLGVRRRGRTHRSSTQVRTSSFSNITILVDQNFENYPDWIFFALCSEIIQRRKLFILIPFIWCCNYIDFLIMLSLFISITSFTHFIICSIIIFSFYTSYYYHTFCSVLMLE